MDATETFLPAGNTGKPDGTTSNTATNTTDFFDFVETPADPPSNFNRSLKSLGVFIEPNNNDKSQNKDCQYDNVFWSDKDKFSTNLLDDIGTWNDWKNGNDHEPDGSVYTLTVLNSTDTWYRVPEETPPSTSKQKSDLDLDSLLNTIQENNNFYYNQNYKNEYFEDSGYCETKEDQPFDGAYWKNDNNNNGNAQNHDSLLRSALQGKALQKTYTNTKYESFPPDEKQNLDEIFKEINTFTEDFEKMKSDPISDVYNIQDRIEPLDVVPIQNSMQKLNKKYAKKNTFTANMKNGVRKERSLHYCSICNKGFKDKYSVNVHVRTHTGEKPFSCNLCGKSFRQKAHLAKHYQTHLAQSQKHHHLANGSCSKSKKTLEHR